MIDPKHISDTVLARTAKCCPGGVEIYLRSSVATSVEIKDQKVDAFERARDIGIGLRVLTDERIGFAFTTDFTREGLATLVDGAIDNAKSIDRDPLAVLPEIAGASYSHVIIHDPVVAGISEQEKIDRVMAMERAAYGVDSRIKRIRKASASFSESETLIRSSRGNEVSYRSTAVSASIEAVAEAGGEAQAGWDFDVRRFYKDIDIEGVGRRAASKALDLLGARHIDSVKAPVILDNAVAEEFLSILASGFSAENVQKKKSLLIGKLDRAIASPLITIIDDGLREGGLGTAPSDDELVPTRTKTVVDKGRLSMFLYNAYTARKDGTQSTGNGIRGGFKGIPGVGMTNLFIQPGTITPAQLISDTERGLLVTEIMGAHTANPISGDFSVGATGFWIEKGAKAYPVREITIAGNILDVMMNVDAVCSDLRFSGRIGSPSLRIKELSISGK
ncbi:MAG: TldD/PmbA family protein [Nitrospirota bacterium]|nr:TldD/PmbA family protein [Nitrospirota bacterium]